MLFRSLFDLLQNAGSFPAAPEAPGRYPEGKGGGVFCEAIAPYILYVHRKLPEGIRKKSGRHLAS